MRNVHNRRNCSTCLTWFVRLHSQHINILDGWDPDHSTDGLIIEASKEKIEIEKIEWLIGVTMLFCIK